MMPELHKIKLHSQEARSSREEDEDEGAYWIKQCPFHISKAHVPHSKVAGVFVTTCHSLCASVYVCLCVCGKSNLYATLRAVLPAHTLNDCASSALRLRREHTTFSLSLSLYVCPFLSGHLLSVVLTMLKTSSPNSVSYDLRDLCALCKQTCSSSFICASHTSIPF